MDAVDSFDDRRTGVERSIDVRTQLDFVQMDRVFLHERREVEQANRLAHHRRPVELVLDDSPHPRAHPWDLRPIEASMSPAEDRQPHLRSNDPNRLGVGP